MTRLRLFAVLIMLITAFVIIAPNTSNDRVAAAGNEITNYRQWTKVNATPALMPAVPATLCAPQLPGKLIDPNNPHHQKYITVYVNGAGRAAMLHNPIGKFPVGSIIVKEKLTQPNSRQPELLTVMIKRNAGFNPGNGDWEYLIYSGDADKEIERGKIARCQTCHQKQQLTDFVFGSYKN